MKIWGTVSPWIELEGDSLLMGRYVANNEFIKALLLHTLYDEYHFYVFNDYYRRITLDFFKKEPAAQGKVIRVFLKKVLIENLSNIDYYVFHQGGWYMDNPTLIHLREKYTKRYFPITGIIHSINDFNTLQQTVKYLVSKPMKFDSIVSTSTAGKSALTNYFKQAQGVCHLDFNSSIDIIPLAYPNGFDTLTPVPKSNARKQLGVKDQFTILYLGRLSFSTKLDLANMLHNLKEYINSNSINIILAGGASENDQKNLDAVIDLMSIDRTKIQTFYNFHHTLKPVLYSASDVFISPVDNLQETFGITVPEAKFFGVVPLVSDWNGYKDTVNHGKDGFKIPTYSFEGTGFELDDMSELIGFNDFHYSFSQTVYIDYSDLIEKLTLLMNDESIRKKMSMNARGHSRKFYSWKSVMAQYVTLWDRLRLEANEVQKECKDCSEMFINYRDIFSDYFETFHGSLSLVDNWNSSLHILLSMNLQFFFKKEDIEALIKDVQKGVVNFDELTNHQKGIAMLLLKWNVLQPL